MLPLRKISWRTFVCASSVGAALDAARSGRHAVVELEPAVDVPLVRPAYTAAVGEKAREFMAAYARTQRYRAAAIELAVVPNAIFLPQRTVLAFGPEGNLVCDELEYNLDYGRILDIFEKPGPPYCLTNWLQGRISEAPTLDSPGLIIHPKYFRNYIHWHVEALAQVPFALERLPEIPNFYFPEVAGAARDSLLIAAGDRFPVHLLDQPAYRLPVASVLTHSLFRTFIHPVCAAALRQISATARAAICVQAEGRRYPVYLARRDAPGTRPLLNEDELCTRLDRLGFRIVVAGDLSYAEQVRLFAEASMLVGPIGAGLCNMTYLPPGSPVLELRALHRKGGQFWDHSFRILAQLVDRPYAAMVFENTFDSDEWTVDVDAVEAAVAALSSMQLAEPVPGAVQ